MWNLRKAFSLRTIKICRFDIIDGVKYVSCYLLIKIQSFTSNNILFKKVNKVVQSSER